MLLVNSSKNLGQEINIQCQLPASEALDSETMRHNIAEQ
jgi:hypothetical protein